MNKSALLIVDMQKDFMPSGSLAVQGADTIIPCINELMPFFSLVIASKDFHPSYHVSFASSHKGKKVGDVIAVLGKQQVLWPDHCIQGTDGATIDPRIDIAKVHHFVHKGVNKEIDSYSTFFDNAHNMSTGLAEYLKKEGVEKLFLCGVATEYCVLYSALDALKMGFTVFVINDACKGIDLHQGDDNAALALMKKNGAFIIHSQEVIKYL